MLCLLLARIEAVAEDESDETPTLSGDEELFPITPNCGLSGNVFRFKIGIVVDVGVFMDPNSRSLQTVVKE